MLCKYMSFGHSPDPMKSSASTCLYAYYFLTNLSLQQRCEATSLCILRLQECPLKFGIFSPTAGRQVQLRRNPCTDSAHLRPVSCSARRHKHLQLDDGGCYAYRFPIQRCSDVVISKSQAIRQTKANNRRACLPRNVKAIETDIPKGGWEKKKILVCRFNCYESDA